MKENNFFVVPGIGAIPAKGTKVWYIRSNMVAHKFIVQEAEWVGGVSDFLRMAKGNIYFTQEEAIKVEMQLNERLEFIKEATYSEEYKKKLADDEARRKAESEERKRQRNENSAVGFTPTDNLSTSKVNAAAYGKRRKVSQHPDIIA